MRNAVVRLSMAGFAILLLVVPLSGHHEIAAKFDPTKAMTLRGVVTAVEWLNPHVHIYINVPGAGGATNWAVELPSVVDLRESGWRRDSVKPGDSVTVDGLVARDGSKQVWSRSMTLATGKQVFNLTTPKPAAAAARPTPRWPDGQPRLGPPPGETGYWGHPSSTMLIQAGATVQADAEGLLRNANDVDKVAPLQPWARALYYLRQREFLKDDPMYQGCLPPGGPRMYQIPYGVQFMEEKERRRIWVFMGGANHNWRHLYLDGREQKGQITGDADNPLFFGRSVGKWEGDTLVIDVKDFNERFWFSNGGLPHTDYLHLIERYSRPDFNTLRYEVTIDDPGAYTKMWTSSWTLTWVPNEELPVYYCQDNRP